MRAASARWASDTVSPLAVDGGAPRMVARSSKSSAFDANVASTNGRFAEVRTERSPVRSLSPTVPVTPRIV